MTAREAADRLQKGEEVYVHFSTKKEKDDFDYNVLQKLLDLTSCDMRASSRALVRLKSTPAP